MTQNTFNRVEAKYLLTENQYASLMDDILCHLEKNEYFYSTISNIYFDSTDNELLINSIEKPVFKQKVRLRSYKVPNVNDNVFLEIKSKYKSIVFKRRIEMTLKSFNQFMKEGILPDQTQIGKELKYLFDFYNLRPAYYISYNRLSYTANDDKNLRVTFDKDVIFRDNDLDISKGSYGKNLLSEQQILLEIKSLNSLPLWFVKSLSDNNIYPTSFSKVGNAYIKERMDTLC